jgi:hypothetical protein
MNRIVHYLHFTVLYIHLQITLFCITADTKMSHLWNTYFFCSICTPRLSACEISWCITDHYPLWYGADTVTWLHAWDFEARLAWRSQVNYQPSNRGGGGENKEIYLVRSRYYSVGIKYAVAWHWRQLLGGGLN